MRQRVIPVHRRGVELGGCLLGPVGHLVADRPHLEPIGQHAQRRGVALLPHVSQADDADTEFHGGLPFTQGG